MKNQFHLVELRPWPLIRAGAALGLTSGLTVWIHLKRRFLLIFRLFLLFFCIFNWNRDIIREATFQGFHNIKVVAGLHWGMILFITSEVCFFFAFFWAFFHSSLSPTPELGAVWPPLGIRVIHPFSVPLLNTGVLLLSGVSVTWAHHLLLSGKDGFIPLCITVVLGLYFTFLQGMEYFEASFSLTDSVYGSTFFVATGFHGLHVIIGRTMLAVIAFRCWLGHFSAPHHFGFEAAAWYWHFVDVVWLFLFVSIYWWGS